MLSHDTLAVTVAEADTYCATRGIAWAGETGDKLSALFRGQTYIAGMYNARWSVEFDDATAPDVVKYAIIEAATRELVTPFCLSPDLTPGREKVLTQVGNLAWKHTGTGGAAGLIPVLVSVQHLLSSVTTGGPMGGTSFIKRA